MIQFIYDGNATLEEQIESKEAFIQKVGSFYQELDENDATITINFRAPKDASTRFTFVLTPPEKLHSFIARFNETQQQ